MVEVSQKTGDVFGVSRELPLTYVERANSSGTVTNYDSRGRVISRESTSGSGTTTVYDARGRNVGRFTTSR
jgi:YD repeat-containing protein